MATGACATSVSRGVVDVDSGAKTIDDFHNFAAGHGLRHLLLDHKRRRESLFPGSGGAGRRRHLPDTIFAAVQNRQPIVAWVAFAYPPQPIEYMRAFDGRDYIMYGAPDEHAVTISGWAPGYLLINNPHSHPEWIDAPTFAAAYGMFDNMAVILQKPPPPPPPSPSPSLLPLP